jgi:hypothetical protein
MEEIRFETVSDFFCRDANTHLKLPLNSVWLKSTNVGGNGPPGGGESLAVGAGWDFPTSRRNNAVKGILTGLLALASGLHDCTLEAHIPPVADRSAPDQ